VPKLPSLFVYVCLHPWNQGNRDVTIATLGLGEKLKSSSPREFFTGYNPVITCPELRGKKNTVKNSNFG
jgi:hypothetical protein